MKDTLGMSSEPAAESKTPQAPPRAASAAKPVPELSPGPRRRRGRKGAAEIPAMDRFFLAAAPNADGGVPALGRELANEGEAIIEAFREGVNFFAISEYRTRADLSASRDPILKKEAVKSEDHSRRRLLSEAPQ